MTLRGTRSAVLGVVAATSAVVLVGVPSAATTSTPQPSSATAQTPVSRWADRLDALVQGWPTSVVFATSGQTWYRIRAQHLRVPASNQKLLLSMAMLDKLGQTTQLTTTAVARSRIDSRGGVDRLWLQGSGDPFTARGQLARLADQLVAAGVRKIAGGIVGATTPFRRDHTAVGWKRWFDNVLVPTPTALVYQRNTAANGMFLPRPELWAADVLTAMLQARGVVVGGTADAGPAPGRVVTLATVGRPLVQALTRTDRVSDNFAAEVLGKRLAWQTYGRGSMAQAGRAICAFERRIAVSGRCFDASGLSYANRQTALGMVNALLVAQQSSWGPTLRMMLPRPGVGSLDGRLAGLTVRAKTGTLTDISALSGWVKVQSDNRWVAFSIMTRGVPSTKAKLLEDQIVRLVATRATAP